MSEAFTPGPWVLFGNTNVRKEGGRMIANCAVYSDNRDGGQSEKDNEANAHLIAAAPDLYAALKHISDQGRIVSVAEIEAALAKARGETP